MSTASFDIFSLMNQIRNHVCYLNVPADREGQRIDNFLLAHFKGLPKTHVYKILRRGEIRVNRKRVKPNYKLRVGDSIRVPPLYSHEKIVVKHNEELLNHLYSLVIYEDENILVLNKPAGLAVHRGSGLATSVIDSLKAMYPGIDIQLAHRLDKQTSGCLLCTKRLDVLRKIQQGFKDGRIKKQYQALVKGRWKIKRQSVALKLGKHRTTSGERLTKTMSDGKNAHSLFTTQRHWTKASLMQVQILTGRTHQIRVHAAAKGHPIAGDGKYGDKEFNKAVLKLGLKRLYLHAFGLQIPIDILGKAHRFQAELPEELETFLGKLANL